MKFNMKSNEIITDFKLLPCYIKSKLFTTFCTDAYGCQLWNFESREVHNFYVAWRKVVRKLWRLPYITHCNLLHTINNSLPIQISLEKRGVKSIWSCLNSDNCVVKTISQLATKLPRSVFGHNYRWKYFNGDTTCECGQAPETTKHMLQCPLLAHPCTLDDLQKFNENARKCVDKWKNAV